MGMESPSGAVVPAFAAWLADVVEQCCPTQPQRGVFPGNIVKHLKGVVEIILVLLAVTLFYVVHRSQLWEDERKDT